jgi:hypothetical protein
VDGVVFLEGKAAGAPVGEFIDIRLTSRRGFDFVGRANPDFML